jgi:hypothetical protein
MALSVVLKTELERVLPKTDFFHGTGIEICLWHFFGKKSNPKRNPENSPQIEISTAVKLNSNNLQLLKRIVLGFPIKLVIERLQSINSQSIKVLFEKSLFDKSQF